MTNKNEFQNLLSADPPKRVIVIGAGVAGLTAAQELAERGYEVEVIEQAPDPYDPRVPRVGGMARTSWARMPEPTNQDPFRAKAPGKPGLPDLVQLESDTAPQPLWIKLDDPADLAKANQYIAAAQIAQRPLAVTVCCQKIHAHAAGPFDLPDFGGDALRKGWSTLRTSLKRARISVLETPDAQNVGVQLMSASDRAPGEHGFRFFPSFYRHLFDTMQRIPLLEASLGAPSIPGTVPVADSSRSAFDNLESADAIQLGLPRVSKRGVRTFDIARRPLRSLEVLRRFLGNVLERAGYRGQGIYRLGTRYLEYLSSAPERRWHEYEEESWSEFLGLEAGGYSPYFVSQVESGSQALVAMSSDKNDARTIGSVALALSLDQVRASDYVDGTLRGPTSVELFGPWQAYLESLGVKFTLGQLVGFVGQGMAVRPCFGIGPTGGQGSPKLVQIPVDPADYYVNTVPVNVMRSLFSPSGEPVDVHLDPDQTKKVKLLSKAEVLEANRLCLELDRLEEEGSSSATRVSDNDDLGRYLDADWLTDPAKNPDDGPLRYMTGIQFYFGADVKLIKGHTLCLDSQWGVSYLSQVQYWQDRQRGENGARGVVSAIFTKWTVPTAGRDGSEKTALDCTPHELAERVWLQIAAVWNAKLHGPLPTPHYFYLDESLTYTKTESGTPKWTNATPYLVNDVGTWAKRPGKRTGSAAYEYQLQLGHTVFAGAFMRSVTRLNTMEAANETARRAVNAILRREARLTSAPTAQACELWNLEDYELGELLQVRDLDRRIARKGGRNLLRSGLVEAILRGTPWDLVRLGFPTYKDLDSDL